MLTQITAIQPSSLSKELVDQNLHIDVKLNQTVNSLNNESLTNFLSLPTLFDKERNESNKIRFGATINPYFSNVLFNYSGDKSYLKAAEKRVLLPPLLFSDLGYFYEDSDVIGEKNGWFYYKDLDECDKVEFEPVKERFSIKNEWAYFLTYPHSTYLTPIVFNGINIKDGLAIKDVKSVTLSGRNMLEFETFINHGLSESATLSIRSITFSGLEGDFIVYKTGDENSANKSRKFLIDNNLPIPANILSYQLYFNETKQGVVTQYISRWFKKISDENAISITQNGFSTTVYADTSYNIQYNKVVDISNLADYLGRPLTNLYLTAHKKNINIFWTNVQVGLSTSYNDNYSIYSLNTITPNSIGSISQPTDDLFFGDIIAFNQNDLSELVIETAQHRFNTLNREDNNFLEGYYYEPHKQFIFKSFGTFINSSINDVNIPDYAILYDDGVLRWKNINLLQPSNNNPTFLNGTHYLYATLSLYLKRQFPCNTPILNGNETIIDRICDVDEIKQAESVIPVLVC